jgi:hypothetical protein
LPQGLPKKIELQLLPPDLALKLSYPPPRRQKRLGLTGSRRIGAARQSNPTRASSPPQRPRTTATEMQPPFVKMKLRHPKLRRKTIDRLPAHQPLNGRKLEFRIKYPTLPYGHQFSPSRTVPCFRVSF